MNRSICRPQGHPRRFPRVSGDEPDIWEVRVNPFHLSRALAHVTLAVDTDRLNDDDGRVLIALGILEAVKACTRTSEMVERLDGAYIHDDDWDEEQFVLEP